MSALVWSIMDSFMLFDDVRAPVCVDSLTGLSAAVRTASAKSSFDAEEEQCPAKAMGASFQREDRSACASIGASFVLTC